MDEEAKLVFDSIEENHRSVMEQYRLKFMVKAQAEIDLRIRHAQTTSNENRQKRREASINWFRLKRDANSNPDFQAMLDRNEALATRIIEEEEAGYLQMRIRRFPDIRYYQEFLESQIEVINYTISSKIQSMKIEFDVGGEITPKTERLAQIKTSFEESGRRELNRFDASCVSCLISADWSRHVHPQPP